MGKASAAYLLRTRLPREGDERAQKDHGGWSNPPDPPESLQGPKGSEGIPVGHDPPSECRPHPRQQLDLRLGGGIQIDRARWPGLGAGLPFAGAEARNGRQKLRSARTDVDAWTGGREAERVGARVGWPATR